jgi:NAD(P)H dehydrogenase (quinone)
MGLATTTPSDASVDEMAPGDLETARRFGQRVAATLARLRPAANVD